jgi:signal transduction histidine kinase
MATNPFHMLFYSYYDFYRDDFGPLFYVQQTYSYGLLLIGIAYCSKQFLLEYHHKRIQAVVISTAVLIPLIVNVFYILGLYKLLFGFRPLFDITPIACNLSLVLFAVAAFRFRFLDTAAIAWRTVFNQIPEGVLLMNKRKAVTDMNRTARMTPETEEITQAALQHAEADSPLDFLHITSSNKYFRVQWSAPSGNSRRKGYMLRFIDETSYQQALLSLSEKNQALARINHMLSKRADAKQALTVYKIRNHIGREVHDILGHSIVLALSVLEVARISLKEDLILARDKLDQAISIIRNAEKQMDHSLLHHWNETLPKSKGLLFELDKMVNEIRKTGQTISLTVQGASEELPANISEAVLRLCQEAVTNAIRHGRAEKIDIILRLFIDHLEIYIMDNGIGCSVIKQGFGLSGMEERIVNNLKGILNFGSLEGGFSVRAEIPLAED